MDIKKNETGSGVSFSDDDRRNMLFGEVLLKQSLISEEQLSMILNTQMQSRVGEVDKALRIGELVVNMGYANESQIVDAVNRHYGIAASSLRDNIESLIKESIANKKTEKKGLHIPIWSKLSMMVFLLVLTTIFILSFFILKRQEEALYKETVKTGKVSLNYFVNNAKSHIVHDNVLALNELLKGAADVEGIVYAFIADSEGKILAHTDHNLIGVGYRAPKGAMNVVKEGDISYFNYATLDGRLVLDIYKPINMSGKLLGNAHVGLSTDFIKEQTRRAKISIVILSLVILFASLVFTVFLGFSFTRPISLLVTATREIGKGNLSHKLDIKRRDEFGDLAESFNYMSEELKMKSVMQETFGRYVSPEILEMILTNPEDTWLKGTRCEATILMADLRNFTSYTENHEPEEVVENLNEYFAIASQCILDYGGYVDKFIGDAVLGVFGVPISREDHAERAVRAALQMQAQLRAKAEQTGNPLLLSVGIGIATGTIVSGNLGSKVKTEYSVIGDSVNLSSRMSGIARAGEVIITTEVLAFIDKIASARHHSSQAVKGKALPVEFYLVEGMK